LVPDTNGIETCALTHIRLDTMTYLTLALLPKVGHNLTEMLPPCP